MRLRGRFRTGKSFVFIQPDTLRQAVLARSAVHSTFSPTGPSRPAAARRLIRTLEFAPMRYFLGLLFLLGFLSIVETVFSLIQYNMTATGVVIAVDATPYSDTGWATIRYMDLTGANWILRERHRVVKRRVGARTYYQPPVVGESVEVKYIQATPNAARIRSVWIAECILAFLGAVLLPATAYSIYRLSSRS